MYMCMYMYTIQNVTRCGLTCTESMESSFFVGHRGECGTNVLQHPQQWPTERWQPAEGTAEVMWQSRDCHVTSVRVYLQVLKIWETQQYFSERSLQVSCIEFKNLSLVRYFNFILANSNNCNWECWNKGTLYMLYMSKKWKIIVIFCSLSDIF